MSDTLINAIAGVILMVTGAGGAAWYLAIKGAPQRAATLAETVTKPLETVIDNQEKHIQELMAQVKEEKTSKENCIKDLKTVTAEKHSIDIENQKLRLENLAARNNIKLK